MSGREEEIAIRQACIDDVPGILRIYNEVIASSTAIYIDNPVTLDNREAWLREQQKRGYPVLVADQGSGDIAGFCSFGDWRGAWPAIALPSSTRCTSGPTAVAPGSGESWSRQSSRTLLRSTSTS